MPIFDRRLALVVVLALAGCGKPADVALADAERGQRNAAEANGRVLCALSAAPTFSGVCEIERMKAANGLGLTIRHPDGGFHRLLVTADGRGLIAADGAEQAKVVVVGPQQIEVTIGGDRYRLPATIKGR